MPERDKIKGDLSRQSAAAASLIAELSSDDAQLNHDMIEGETTFFEAVESALDEIQECDVLVSGLNEHIKRLQDRLARIKGRSDRVRGMIDQAFSMAEIQSHAFPRATVSKKRIAARLLITDESMIPSVYFTPQPPKLDKKALTAAAKNGGVPGVSMSNGGETIQIRWA